MTDLPAHAAGGRMPITFEWNKAKSALNEKKQGVSFAEACTVSGDRLSITIPDPLHSVPGEERLITVGRSARGRLLVVVHLEQGQVIRIISARRATRHERINYEEEL
jgi:uncharacterized DUF497 family protein